jgi:predicted nucleic acid-binding protein
MFWDSSALVPLVVEEPGSAQVRSLVEEPREARVIWWGTRVECASALARAVREGRLPGDRVDETLERLATLVAESVEVQPIDAVRGRALRLLRVHPLRAADSLQLAAALVASEEHPEGAGFVCLDGRLRDAARAEGFLVLPE